MIAEETILAYVDGELSPGEAREVEAAMSGDPVLARRVADHRALREAASGVFAGVLSEPAPERLLAAVRGEATVVAPRFGRAARRMPGLPQWAALAASLVLGVMLGQGLGLLNRGPVRAGPQGLEARGDLAGALDRRLSADAGPVRIGISFRDQERTICRTFLVEAEAFAGLACREEGRWIVRVAAQAEPGEAGGGYRMAAAAMPPAVLGAVDQMIAGEPLDRVQEGAARDAGWR